ncbi:uncharacterized protein O3C94_010030 [Discoglossus pictus]
MTVSTGRKLLAGFPGKQMSSAGQFEHVAHMNVFDGQLRPLSVPVKFYHVKLPFEDTEFIKQGFGEDNKSRVKEQEEEPKKKDEISKILDQVKLDLQMRARFDRSDSEDEEYSRSSPKKTFNTLSNGRGKNQSSEKHKKIKLPESPENEEEEWQRAQEQVEQFLDFPAFISGMEFRNLRESCNINPMVANDHMVQSDMAPIPNTRHNALFLRELDKPLQKFHQIQQNSDVDTFNSSGQWLTCPQDNDSQITNTSARLPMSEKREFYQGKSKHINTPDEINQFQKTKQDEKRHPNKEQRDDASMDMEREQNTPRKTKQMKNKHMETPKRESKQMYTKKGRDKQLGTEKEESKHLDITEGNTFPDTQNGRIKHGTTQQ